MCVQAWRRRAEKSDGCGDRRGDLGIDLDSLADASVGFRRRFSALEPRPQTLQDRCGLTGDATLRDPANNAPKHAVEDVDLGTIDIHEEVLRRRALENQRGHPERPAEVSRPEDLFAGDEHRWPSRVVTSNHANVGDADDRFPCDALLRPVQERLGIQFHARRTPQPRHQVRHSVHEERRVGEHAGVDIALSTGKVSHHSIENDSAKQLLPFAARLVAPRTNLGR